MSWLLKKLPFLDTKHDKLVSKIKEDYSFLSNDEIEYFIELHPDLKHEHDFSVIDTCLEEYLRHQALKYTTLLTSFTGAQKEKKSTPRRKEEKTAIDKPDQGHNGIDDIERSSKDIGRAGFYALKHEKRLSSNPNLYPGIRSTSSKKKDNPIPVHQEPENIVFVEETNKSKEEIGHPKEPLNQETANQEPEEVSSKLADAIEPISMEDNAKEVSGPGPSPSKADEEEDQLEEYRRKMREKFSFGQPAEANVVVQSDNFKNMGEERVIPLIEQRRRMLEAAGVPQVEYLRSSDPRIQLGMLSVDGVANLYSRHGGSCIY